MRAQDKIDALLALPVLSEEERQLLRSLIPVAQQQARTEARDAALATCAFAVGDRVLHRAKGSAKRGADARAGVVRRVYASEGARGIVAKLSVDWPTPNRIGGDGWHRSDVTASAVILATAEEIERRRALNRVVNARNQAHWNAENGARRDAAEQGRG